MITLTEQRLNHAKDLSRMALWMYLEKTGSESICETLEAFDNATSNEYFLQSLVVIVNIEFDKKGDLEKNILQMVNLFSKEK